MEDAGYLSSTMFVQIDGASDSNFADRTLQGRINLYNIWISPVIDPPGTVSASVGTVILKDLNSAQDAKGVERFEFAINFGGKWAAPIVPLLGDGDGSILFENGIYLDDLPAGTHIDRVLELVAIHLVYSIG